MRPQFVDSRLRAFGLALAVLAAASLIGSAQTTQTTNLPSLTTELRLVSTVWPPFTNRAGEPRFALDLVEEGLRRMGITTTSTLVEPAEFTDALLTKFDGSAAAWKDLQRESVLLYSEPYLENRLILVGRKGSEVSATALAALRGKKVAIVEGYSYGNIDSGGPIFIRSHSEEDSLAKLLEGTVEYMLMDELVVQYLVSNYSTQVQTRLQLGSAPLVTRKLHLALRRSLPDADAIITRFNSQLRTMIADRTYHRLLHVSWIVADIDGDGVPEYVPASDTAGPTPPKNAYSLFTERPSGQPTVPDMSNPGFYVGGTIYPDWAAVPDKYKIPPSPVKPEDQNPSRHTASGFKFTWK